MNRSSKASSLRDLLERPRPGLLCGVYDGLSARLAERAGFDALWASGFCISASKRIPDVGLITMTEHVLASTEIDRASSLPVVADVDDGFGDAVNVTRTVRAYEAAGIAAICLEDNRHPKRSSLYTGVERSLVSASEFAAKIRAAKSAQTDPGFVVIARTESLVAGLDLDEALRRAGLYADEGADLILVHATDRTPARILEFGSRWKRDVPLVAVPTTYPGVPADDLFRAGYRLVIFANQGMRAAVSAMSKVFRRLVETRSGAAVEADIASLGEIFTLVDLDEVKRIEAEFAASADARREESRGED
jgi:phosphoenolpyruvate phosphomutase